MTKPPSDDEPKQQSRRSMLIALGSTGLGVAAGAVALSADAGTQTAAASLPATAAEAALLRPSCQLSPEEMTGPYYLDIDKLRHTIAEDRVGVPLDLTFILINSVTCLP